MNSNVMPSIVQIEKENLKELVTQVKETLATNINLQPSKIKNKRFGIVDLWNCQRNVRTAVSMRKH
jgi:translation elongation factor EF-1beta